MGTARLLLLLLVCARMAVPASADTVRDTRTFEWRPGRRLVIQMTVGSVRLEGSGRNDVEIAVQRTAPDARTLGAFPLDVQESDERVQVRLVQPDGRTDPAVRADLVVRMPSTALVERIDILEGRLLVERFRGELTAAVQRGPIEGKDLSGVLRLETGIGSISLEGTRLETRGLLRLRAFNGDVRLRMPGAPTNARILALALNGSIRSDIPMTSRDTWGPHWSEASLGAGEPVISIDVVTGGIDIRTR